MHHVSCVQNKLYWMCFYAFYSSFWGMMTPQSAFKEIFIQVIQVRNLFKKPYHSVKKIHEHLLHLWINGHLIYCVSRRILRGTVFVQTHCLLQLHKHLQKITMILTEISVQIPPIKLTFALKQRVTSPSLRRRNLTRESQLIKK